MISRIVTGFSYHCRRWFEYTKRLANLLTRGSRGKEESLWTLFVVLNTFLKDSDVPHWVSFGTMLGLHRENGLIQHDIDIDFSCEEEHYELLWSRRHLLPHGIRMYDSSMRHFGPKLYITLNGYDADIYFYRNEDGHLHPFEKTEWQNYRNPIPVEFILPVEPLVVEIPKDVKMLDLDSHQADGNRRSFETFAPANAQGYLTFIYGSLAKDAVRNKETGFWE